MNKSESITELAKALSAFQGEVKQPLKDANNPFFKSKYVPLENVVEAITETAPKHGLSFLQFPINSEDKVGIKTLLMHNSGEWIETDAIYAKPGKNDAQATGSVITYLKRYSLSAVFGITSDEDDDGNSASNNNGQQYNKPQNAPTKPSGPKMASEAQVKMIGAKVGTVAKKEGADAVDVYKGVQDTLKIQKATKELTAADASKFINHLITLEG